MKVEKCKNCTHYTPYYKQWCSSYSRLSDGFCSKHRTIKTQFESCDEYKSNEQKEKMREKMRLEHLDNALKALIEIAHILKETDEQ